MEFINKLLLLDQNGSLTCIIGIILFMMIFIFPKIFVIGKTNYKYRKPYARWKTFGVIEVIGDVHELQHNTSIGTWVHKGTNKWEIHLPNSYKDYHQQDIIDSINDL